MPRFDLTGLVAILCSELLLANLAGCGGHRATLPEAKPPAAVFDPLQQELKKSYLTLFETASKLEYSESQILKMQEYLKQAQDYCVGRFEGVAGEYERRVEEAQKGLKKKDIADEQRHNLHCRIQDSRDLLRFFPTLRRGTKMVLIADEGFSEDRRKRNKVRPMDDPSANWRIIHPRRVYSERYPRNSPREGGEILARAPVSTLTSTKVERTCLRSRSIVYAHGRSNTVHAPNTIVVRHRSMHRSHRYGCIGRLRKAATTQRR